MLVVDLQPMRIQESGADQAFFVRTDEHLSQQVFSEPLEVQGIPEVLETLLRGEFRLKRSQGSECGPLSPKAGCMKRLSAKAFYTWISSPTISRNFAGEPMGVSLRVAVDRYKHDAQDVTSKGKWGGGDAPGFLVFAFESRAGGWVETVTGCGSQGDARGEVFGGWRRQVDGSGDEEPWSCGLSRWWRVS